MAQQEVIVAAFDTAFGHYEIVDVEYEGRPSRVIFSGDKIAAQSGLALDDGDDLLFDYNQRFIELVTSLQPRTLLLIGGGAMTLPTALAKLFEALRIDVMERDPELLSIAETFFGFVSNDRITCLHGDGMTLLQKSSQKYDLIIIDAFMNATIPPSLMSEAAIREYRNHTNPGGSVAMNVISAFYGRNAVIIEEIKSQFEKDYKTVKVFPASRSLVSLWMPQNLVLVAQQAQAPQPQMRYEALDTELKA